MVEANSVVVPEFVMGSDGSAQYKYKQTTKSGASPAKLWVGVTDGKKQSHMTLGDDGKPIVESGPFSDSPPSGQPEKPPPDKDKKPGP